MDEPLSNPISRADACAALHIVIMLQTLVYGEEQADEQWYRKLTDRLARAGIVPTGASAGELMVGLTELNSRLRWALEAPAGSSPPEPHSRLASHQGVFPTKAGAEACAAVVADAYGLRTEVMAWGDRWELVIYTPELPPDPAFKDQVLELSQLISKQGGRYAGSGV